MRSELRPATATDVPTVLELWCEAAAPTSTDTEAAVAALLSRDPGALIVAEAGGRVVGTVVAAWDGWRASVYRLVVAPAHRRQGVGARLLRAAEDRVVALGAQRMHAIVVGTDAGAVAFWEATDWERQAGQLRYTKG